MEQTEEIYLNSIMVREDGVRGYFSSAETAGEFYGIANVFNFSILKYKKLNPLSLFLVFSTFGIIFIK